MTSRKQSWRRFTAAPGFRGGMTMTLLVAVGGCSESMPTEATIEMPLFAAAEQAAEHKDHTGVAGRPFDLEMSQELSTTAAGVQIIGDANGIGTALITLNAGLGQVCWSLTAESIQLPATASHIHRGPDGVAGPIVLGLTAPGADGTSSGCANNVDRELIVEMLSNAKEFYVNVHTSEHPPGAIRAQLK